MCSCDVAQLIQPLPTHLARRGEWLQHTHTHRLRYCWHTERVIYMSAHAERRWLCCLCYRRSTHFTAVKASCHVPICCAASWNTGRRMSNGNVQHFPFYLVFLSIRAVGVRQRVIHRQGLSGTPFVNTFRSTSPEPPPPPPPPPSSIKTSVCFSLSHFAPPSVNHRLCVHSW